MAGLDFSDEKNKKYIDSVTKDVPDPILCSKDHIWCDELETIFIPEPDDL